MFQSDKKGEHAVNTSCCLFVRFTVEEKHEERKTKRREREKRLEKRKGEKREEKGKREDGKERK